MNASRLAEGAVAVVLAAAIDIGGLAAIASLINTPARPERSELRIADRALFQPRVVAELAIANASSNVTAAAAEPVVAEGTSATPSVKPESSAGVTAAGPDGSLREDTAAAAAVASGSSEIAATRPGEPVTASSSTNILQTTAPNNVSAGTAPAAKAIPAIAPPALSATSDGGQSFGETSAGEIKDSQETKASEIAAAAGPAAETATEAPTSTETAAAGSTVTESATAALPSKASLGAVAESGQALAEAPADAAPTAGQSVGPGSGGAAVVAALPPSEPLKPPKRLAAADIAQVVQGFAGPPCFLAVPRQAANDSWSVASYGAVPAVLDDFAAYLKAKLQQAVALDARTLQGGQCAAVDFAKAFAAQAPGEFVFAVDQRNLASGGRLTATISGYRANWLYVLLVDDDGVAQDVSSFATVSGVTVKLEIPVNLKGGGQARTQLLFAIAASHPLSMLDKLSPTPLAQLLPLLRGEIRAAKADVEIAVADFALE